MVLYNIYAENSVDLENAKNYILKFLERSYIYQFNKGEEEYIIRKGNEYFFLLAQETMGGGVTIFLSSGIKERPNVEYFSHFWNGYTSYNIERSRKFLKAYIKQLQVRNGLTATGAAVLGFQD